MISIPNPCQEDFDKMKPTERGAFCGKCETDTFDFRNLNSDQIVQIMDENKGQHICGRFIKSQLADINSGFLSWKNQSPRTFQSKFLMACVLAFGLGLFSCETEEQAIIENINTEQVIQNIDPEIAQINRSFEILNVDLLDYVVEEQQVIDRICEVDMQGELAGDIAYEAYPNDQNYVLGGVVAYNEHLIAPIEIEIIDTATESTLANPIFTDPDVFVAKAYPNPTQLNSTIELQVENEGQFDIVMYNMNGQMIHNIHSGVLTEGVQRFEIDMQSLNSGMYIVKVISQGQDETLKISKVN